MRRPASSRLTALTLISLAPAYALSQTTPAAAPPQNATAQQPPRPAATAATAAPTARERALQEIEGVLAGADRLADQPAAAAKIRARAAHLLWALDRVRARDLFRRPWRETGAQADGAAAWRVEVRTEILKNLFPRDPSLAKELLKEASDESAGQPPGLRAQVTGADPRAQRLARLSQALVETDVTHAAATLEQALSAGVTPGAMMALIRLRDKSPALADYVVAGALEKLKAQPSAVALTGLYVLSDYVWPSSQAPGDSLIADPPGETLRAQHFAASYEVLQRSLQEAEAALAKELRYSEQDLRFRAIYQAQLASLLAALAPRLAPQVAPELAALAEKLAPALPPGVAQTARFNSARLGVEPKTPLPAEVAIPLLMAKGEFEEAKRLAEKTGDEATRGADLQTIARVQFRNHLAKGELPQALAAARSLQDANARAVLYVQLAQAAAAAKGEREFARPVVAEARAALAGSAPNGLRARALLQLTAAASSALPAPEAVELLQASAASINALSRPGTGADAAPVQSAAWAEINDPRSLVDAPELRQAFAAAGRVDFDGASFAARSVNEKAVALSARLALAAHLCAAGAGTEAKPERVAAASARGQ